MEETFKEAVRQFPMVGLVLAIVWFAWKQYVKQAEKHAASSKEERNAFLTALETTTASCHAHQEKLSDVHAEAIKGSTELLTRIETYLKLQIEKEREAPPSPRKVGGVG